MSYFVYKIKCITNLHVGSGDLNYNIVDNEVERDAVTGYPIIHASGLKGALREHFKKKKDLPSDFSIIEVFGQEAGKEEIKAGSYKFLDAYLLARPMRVSGSIASIMVVSEKSVNDFISRMNAFGIDKYGTELLSIDFPEDVNFFSNVSGIKVEAEDTKLLPESAKRVLDGLKELIGEEVAVVKDLNDYDLPVVARNYLEDGISKNLWYEEVVPHDSVFYTVIITPDDKMKLDFEVTFHSEGKPDKRCPDMIQIGGHASIGCGFTNFTKLN